jgi:hypothetical protein
MTALCTAVLSDLGVFGSIEIHEFPMGFIPLEKDLLSMEYEDVYRKLSLVRVYLWLVGLRLKRVGSRKASTRRFTTWPKLS